MRIIKVTYRAVFEQPIGILNSMGVRLIGPHPVELFFTKGCFYAREIATFHRNVYARLRPSATLERAKADIESVFEKRITNWQMWGTPPGEQTERLILKDEVFQVADKVYFKQEEDYTHIIHTPMILVGGPFPPAACGVKVNAKCIISTRANVEPTCKGCLEVYRRDYASK